MWGPPSHGDLRKAAQPFWVEVRGWRWGAVSLGGRLFSGLEPPPGDTMQHRHLVVSARSGLNCAVPKLGIQIKGHQTKIQISLAATQVLDGAEQKQVPAQGDWPNIMG